MLGFREESGASNKKANMSPQRLCGDNCNLMYEMCTVTYALILCVSVPWFVTSFVRVKLQNPIS